MVTITLARPAPRPNPLIYRHFDDYYAVLGVSPEDTLRTIKAAFVRAEHIALQNNPAKYTNFSKEYEEAEAQLALVYAAYKALSARDRRKIYDREREEHYQLVEYLREEEERKLKERKPLARELRRYGAEIQVHASEFIDTLHLLEVCYESTLAIPYSGDFSTDFNDIEVRDAFQRARRTALYLRCYAWCIESMGKDKDLWDDYMHGDLHNARALVAVAIDMQNSISLLVDKLEFIKGEQGGTQMTGGAIAATKTMVKWTLFNWPELSKPDLEEIRCMLKLLPSSVWEIARTLE